jgi:micrococcal nuclease
MWPMNGERVMQPREQCRWVVVAHHLIRSALCLWLLAACNADGPDPSHATTIVDVIDGDTVVVAFPAGEVETIRLLGVDTPETVDPSRPIQCFGAEASAFVREQLPVGTAVRLERDIEARDHFGRLLAYVFRADNDLFINYELLGRGFADLAIYQPNDAYLESFDAATISARTRTIGLWKACGSADLALDPPPIRAD